MSVVRSILIVLVVAFTTLGVAWADEPPVSEETQACLDCHESVSPGIVADWRNSRHSRTTPTQALTKPELERRMSATEVPEKMRTVVVGCYECHGLNTTRHKDSFKHKGQQINVVVSPNDCKTCHPVEANEFATSKKAHAVENLMGNPTYHQLVDSTVGMPHLGAQGPKVGSASEATLRKTCLGCHGSVVGVDGTRTIESDVGTVKVPHLTNWPNQGVGRVNPDGSRGACTACHSRHAFSIEMARQPYTCAQCHMGPDIPAWEVYKESKHGNIFSSMHAKWNFDAVPWKVGVDFTAPTCAACHASLVVSPDNEVIAKRTHDYGSRLWVRLFGLPYSHPQPKSGRTSIIRNADGQPLPTTLAGVPASKFLIDAKEQKKRRDAFSALCLACHSTDWTVSYFDHLDASIGETDKMVKMATDVMRLAWKKGVESPKNLFDGPIERMWVRAWLFYANSIRYASAMSGPDYATFEGGWWHLNENLQAMWDRLNLELRLRKR